MEIEKMRSLLATLAMGWTPYIHHFATGGDEPHDMGWYLRWCAALLRQDDREEFADQLDVMADVLEADDGT